MSKDFHHPYKPYGIQVQLMTKIYELLNSNKKVGIFESPTGTGKTLSLICSTVTWLREHKLEKLQNGRQVDETSSEETSDEEPEWVNEFYKERILKERSAVLQDYERYLDTLHSTNIKPVLRELKDKGGQKRRKAAEHVEVAIGENEDDFLLAPFESNPGNDDATSTRMELSNEIQSLLSKIDKNLGSKRPEQDLVFKSPLKIFFASRTHSQLTQFASQLSIPSFPPSTPVLEKERIKFLPLASRKQLCVNAKVSKLRSDLIADSCVDTIQKNECQYYTNYKDPVTSKQFRDYTFSEINDIEDLVRLGKTLHTCPYYSSRVSLDGAEVVTLPYQHLLSYEVRQSLGITLKDSIVVVDEAHNLIDTINSIYSCDISLAEITDCKLAMKEYFNRFKRKLNGGNRVNVMKLLKLLDILSSFIESDFSCGREILPQNIFSGNNADLLNIHDLVNYMKVSKIAYKVERYSDWKNEKVNHSRQPLLFKVSKFILSLSNPSCEGTFFFDEGMVIKYMLLEPKEVFKTIVDESKCVILAGGTMQPMNDFVLNLFPYLPNDSIVQFSCDHMIPPSNLNTYVISDNFNFTFAKRNDDALLIRLYNFFMEIGRVVPYGIVAFFPSYAYVEYVIKFWKAEGLFEKLSSIKSIFYESTTVTDILQRYTSKILQDDEGAFLFSVVGGKLSEGINFQDNLARAVVMVGLPYPNIYSTELLVKKKHIEHTILSNRGTRQKAEDATKELYQNICMKAVNQSVGRAIRHINDYACIYLLDDRYNNKETQSRLSAWVRNRIRPQHDVQQASADTSDFFSKKE